MEKTVRIEKGGRNGNREEKMHEKEIPEQEQDKLVLKGETSEEVNSEINSQKDESSQNDEEDLLYTHKPENRDSSIQWNSAFCRKPGH